jgi:hypothetical protein
MAVRIISVFSINITNYGSSMNNERRKMISPEEQWVKGWEDDLDD